MFDWKVVPTRVVYPTILLINNKDTSYHSFLTAWVWKYYRYGQIVTNHLAVI